VLLFEKELLVKPEKKPYSFEAHEAKMLDFELRKKTLVTAMSVLVSALMAVMLGTLGYKFLLQPSPEHFGFGRGGGAFEANGSSISVELEQLKKTTVLMQSDLEKLKSLDSPKPNSAINELSVKLASLETRMRVIEEVILDSPEKALSIPLMKKEQDSLSKRILDFNAASRLEMERQYDLIKWAAGGAFTALFTVFCALVPFVYRRVSGEKGILPAGN
jgi:hypothetical protein